MKNTKSTFQSGIINCLNSATEVNIVQMQHEALREAVPCDNVSLNVKNLSVKELRRGFSAGDLKDNPSKEAADSTIQIIVKSYISHRNEQ